MTILLAQNKMMDEVQTQISTVCNKIDKVKRMSGKEANSERIKPRFPSKESGPKAFAAAAVAETKSKISVPRDFTVDCLNDEEEQVEYAWPRRSSSWRGRWR